MPDMPVLLFLFLLFSASVFAQDTSTFKTLRRYSSILEEERFFEVYVPASSNKKFEVIYVLDGQAQFTNVVNALKQAGQAQKIVVGIGNIWLRDRDYTPTHVDPSPFPDKRAATVSGGGGKFISYLEKELIPYIDSSYSTDNSRILIGHSLGGLIAMDMLLNHSNLFRKYIIIDPSMWWDDGKLMKQSKGLLNKIFKPTYLFLAIANTRNKDKNTIEDIRKDTTLNTAQIRPSVLLLDNLKAYTKNNIKLDWKYYKEYDHMSVFQAALIDGLRFIFK
jgi:predicted alpha/beta superfamily hydrolase